MISENRVFLGSIATETNTFSPLRTDLRDFENSFFAPPGQHPVTPTLCSAIYPAARARAAAFGWSLIEGTATWAEPGGMVNQRSWEFLRDRLLRELCAAMPVDIVLLGLHGAMVANDCFDCEGELIEKVRNLTGPNTVIGVSFDPHSHLTERRVKNADLITVFKEFPHTDFVETAENLVELAHGTANGSLSPVISVFDCRMIDIYPTSREPMRSFIDRLKALENADDILSISIIHGFLAGDVPDLGTRVIVITDNAKEKGDALAKRLGLELYALRGTTRSEYLAPEKALDLAMAASSGPVVIADVWDNPGGGVPGDSTQILREMIRRRLDNAALATIWDPIAVQTCIAAGEGARFHLRFGGKMSPAGGEPIDAEITVKRILRNASQEFCGSVVQLGDCARVKLDGIDIILNSVRSQVFHHGVFLNLDIDPISKSLLVVKSTNHFHEAFSAISPLILYAAVNGIYPSDPASGPYKNLTRKIWPIDKNQHCI